ncbi:MAG: 4Fe-4S binding protein [Spirochaetota bacterium]
MRFRSAVHSASWILLPVFIAAGFFNPVWGYAAVVCMAAPAAMAVKKGRLWCGFFCPRGSLLDMIFPRAKGLFSPMPKKMRRAVRYLFFVFLLSAFSLQLVFSETPEQGGRVFFRMVALTTVLSLLLGWLFGRRSWCGICPMGTLSHLISYALRKIPGRGSLRVDRSQCVSCLACNAVCPMRIDVASFAAKGSVDHSDCTRCGSCAAKCPKKAIKAA